MRQDVHMRIASKTDVLFDAETLRRYESAALLARRAAMGSGRGERRGPHRGSSPEFVDYRAFVSGDDPRGIDWNAFARWRQLVIRLRMEEANLPVYFLLDCSRSMEAGRPPKFDLARRVLGGLAYIALGNLDRAEFVPLLRQGARNPSPSRQGFRRWLEALAACSLQEDPVSHDDCVRSWLATRPRRGVTVLLSDGLGTAPGDTRAALERLVYAGHDPAMIHILSAGDIEPPPVGEYDLEDCESGAVRRVIVDHAAVSAFTHARDEFLQSLERAFGQRGLPYLRVNENEDPGTVLSRVLEWR
jgi:uncharacterized protein (DUF58 family)